MTTSNETGLAAAQPAPPQDVSPLGIVARAASDPLVDADKMERLYALMERQQAQQAEVAFNDAMSAAQGKMGRISADATNPQTRSKYATYGKLDKALRPIYSQHGFSLSFDSTDSPKEDHARFLCYCSHAAGHTRTYRIDIPVDGKGAKGNDVMTKTHAVGSGASYGMRYLLKMIFNVAVGEDDDDGNAAGKPPSEDEIDAEKWVTRANKVATPEEYLAERENMMAFYDALDSAPATLRRIPAAVKRAFSEAKNEVMPKDET
ncbi:MAG: ERF family protein [Pseudomonadota bacterium]